MSSDEYRAIVARIDKAESLPASALADPYVRNAYHDLCDQACTYEIASGGIPWHGIHDKTARAAAQKLLGTMLDINDQSGDNTDALRTSLRRLLTDLMAFAVAASDNTLDIFGYKEVAEDDE